MGLLGLTFFHNNPNQATLNQIENNIPPDGSYVYDVAFAEWDGISMGNKVSVTIIKDSIYVVYNGIGNLEIKTGEVIDSGIIIKHHSGQWIIANKPDDRNLKEIGGCSGGPSIVDFKTRKYWMC